MLFLHLPHGSKRFTGRARHAAVLLYQGLLEPMPYRETLYMGVSQAIMRPRPTPYTAKERNLMHQYAASRLLGEVAPPAEMSVLLVSKVDALISAERSTYRKHHPIKGRRQAAAA